MSKKKSILLIDGTFYLYRAFYAFPYLTNKNNQPTGVIYGTINMINKLLTIHQIKNVIIIFDSPKKNFRNKLFSKYKAHRKPIPEEFKIQIETTKIVIKYLGISTLTIPNYEADDVIGTLSYLYAKKNYLILISTNDKDLGQLVSSNIKIIDSNTKKIIGEKEIEEKHGIKSQFIPDLLGLMGDTSDNIPGIKGIGKKTAVLLIQKFGSIKNIYKNINHIKNLPIRGAENIANKIYNNEKIALLSYNLSKIKTNVPININEISLRIKNPNLDKLIKLFNYYEFTKWKENINFFLNKEKNEINNVNNSKKIKKNKNYDIKSVLLLKKWIKKLNQLPIFSIILELKTIKKKQTKDIIGIGISTKYQESIYINFQKIISNNSKINSIYILNYLKPLLEDPEKTKIGFNLKKYYHILKKYNIQLNGMTFDIMLESYVFYQLKNFCYPPNIINFEQLLFEYINSKNIKKYHENKNQLNFGIQAYIIFQLHNKMWTEIQKDKITANIFYKIDSPLVLILAKMEHTGVLINQELLKNQSNIIKNKLSKLTNQAYQIAGEKFNLASNQQIQKILFIKQKLKITNKTKKGNISTNQFVLQKLSQDNILPKIILEYRSLYKLQSSYLDKLNTMINLETGRIHTSYYQNTTITGRLSSREPNLQNIPIRTKIGKQIRQTFIPQDSFVILSADYSQIELRILAHLSKDKTLKKQFEEKKDIHILTASKIFNIPKNEVTVEQRNNAKKINFSLIYGISPFGLSKQLKISYLDAKKYIKEYFIQYPGIANYLIKIKKYAKTKGFVSTITGRKIYVPNIHSKILNLKESSERTAVNGTIQGTVSDIIKLAMINIDNWLKRKFLMEARMIIQVHDELIFEIKKLFLKKIQNKIIFFMENSLLLDIPIIVNTKTGTNWNDTY